MTHHPPSSSLPSPTELDTAVVLPAALETGDISSPDVPSVSMKSDDALEAVKAMKDASELKWIRICSGLNNRANDAEDAFESEKKTSTLFQDIAIRLQHSVDALRDEIGILQAAAEAVCWFDWSNNDDDAVAAIDRLRALTLPALEDGDMPQAPWPASDWAIDRITALETENLSLREDLSDAKQMLSSEVTEYIEARGAVLCSKEPVAWLRHGSASPVQGAPLGAMWITDNDDPNGFPVYASPFLEATMWPDENAVRVAEGVFWKVHDEMAGAAMHHAISAYLRETSPCPCTTIEQDESCPIGYPSLLCERCDGKGVLSPALETNQQVIETLRAALGVILISDDLKAPELRAIARAALRDFEAALSSPTQDEVK